MNTLNLHRVHIKEQEEACWDNEGRDSPECTAASRYVLRRILDALLLIFAGLIVALAFNAGGFR